MSKFQMLKWAKDLFPICRSITGDGTRMTLSYFEKINPEFRRLKFKTGQKVFDWVIPKEWNIKDAYIQHQSGKKFAEFKKKYIDTFEEEPSEISILAYDALGLIYYCWFNNGSQFKPDQLYNKNGFKGLLGEFTIKDNLSEHRLKIYRISDKKFLKVY